MNVLGPPTRPKHVLVTGGAGYIGSHMCAVLLEAGHPVVIFDNFSSSGRYVVDRIRQQAGGKTLHVVEGDVRDEAALKSVFDSFDVGAVFHFAGKKSAAESMTAPLDYFSHNVGGSLALLQSMDAGGIHTLVFSSSATVYGNAKPPIAESASLMPVNAYGRSKAIVEEMLQDLASSSPLWRIACLRYFNPVGAHPSGRLGEASAEPANLMPYIVQVASGQRPALPVFGNDYPTRDGTGVRDYIHIMDLVEGHLAALDYLRREAGLVTLNLGTGHGVSVLELVSAFESSTGRSVPLQLMARRAGDVAESFADPACAQRLLNWRARRSLEEMCKSSWQFAATIIPAQSETPVGSSS